MTPFVGANGVEIYAFDKYVSSPEGSFGLIGLGKAYRKTFAQENGTDVGVGIEIIGVTNVDSIEKIVGLNIFLRLEWEDNRIQWTLDGPQVGQEWEFDTKVLE